MSLGADLRSLADATDFSGGIAVSRGGERMFELARGFASREHERPNALDTQYATASATKGLTALTVASLIGSGELSWDTTVRSLLEDRLPLVDPSVTIEQLLGHTSGVGDYIDEDAVGDIDDHILALPAHRLEAPQDYLPLIDRLPHASPPGERFIYNNSGYVMLSIAVEAATGTDFHDLVRERVLDPAGMADTAFLRSDELHARAAIGYLQNGRTNIFHLPVRGAGDGGAYSTLADVDALWRALFAGDIVPMDIVERMVAPRSDAPSHRKRYGLGFWLRADRLTVMLEGMDAGVSFRSAFDRPSGLSYTVMANDSGGAWPIVDLLEERLPNLAGG